MDDENGFLLRRTCNKIRNRKREIHQYGVCHNPPMIKLKMNSLGVYHKRIQLESGFWDENCVYLLVLSPFHFIIILTLMGNGSLHLFATVNALQTGILMCITSLLPLLRPLLFDINTHHE